MEDRMVAINEAQRKKEKDEMEGQLRDLWDNIKRPNIQSIECIKEK